MPRIRALCAACPMHAASWLCPPLSPDIERRIDALPDVSILALKITPHNPPPKPPASPRSGDLGTLAMAEGRAILEPMLLRLEQELDGHACGLSGRCPYCPGLPCARTLGEPCRHPDLARPSLEALGYDVTAIAADILGCPILWARDGTPPPYYTLVTALFH
ncbi:MAG: DUF2284 domain-containing protein [Muribaculaceae bacterium]|nr:DUF2284 domain-containing protein [Muribaculaceae bacterium]